MATGENMFKAILQAFGVIAGAITLVGGTFLVLMVYGLFIGAFNYQAQEGNIGVDNATLTSMNNASADYWDKVTTITASIAVVVGFIALALLFMIFRPFIDIGKAKGKTSSGKDDF
ncbi:MAG: hypothetical protein ACOCUD_04220 [Bacillota bacterium]